MRMILGLVLIVIGLGLMGGGAFSGGFGDRDVVSLIAGTSAVFFGIGMLIRGAMRTAIWALAAILFVIAGGFAFIRGVF